MQIHVSWIETKTSQREPSSSRSSMPEYGWVFSDGRYFVSSWIIQPWSSKISLEGSTVLNMFNNCFPKSLWKQTQLCTMLHLPPPVGLSDKTWFFQKSLVKGFGFKKQITEAFHSTLFVSYSVHTVLWERSFLVFIKDPKDVNVTGFIHSPKRTLFLKYSVHTSIQPRFISPFWLSMSWGSVRRISLKRISSYN